MKLFVFAGQSNCLGHGDGDKLPEALKAGNQAVMLFMKGWGFTPEWRPMVPYATGENLAKMYKTGKTNFGPEISFAHAMRERFPDNRIGVVKCAVGGTSVLLWSKDYDSPAWKRVIEESGLKMETARPLYPKLLDEVRSAMAAAGEVEIAGFVWVQTEKDSMHPPAARDWARRVEQLHRDLAADARYSPDIPLIVMAPHFHIFAKGDTEHAASIIDGLRTASKGGSVNLSRLKEACQLTALTDDAFKNELAKMRCYLPGCLEQIEGVGIMQRGLEELAKRHDNLRIVRSDDLPTYEGLHFNTEGLIELGKRFARAVEQKGGSQAITASGNDSAKHQAKFNYTRIVPLLDVPMIDAAIAKGPEGVYYLTGTTGTRQQDGTVDFSLNEGVRLWKSTDLRNWADLGLVAPLSLVKAKIADLALLRTASEADEMKGLIAPEIHFIKGSLYLTYSLKPCGTGLLKSSSGKVEGPYEDVGLITKGGNDASLFVDDDGKVYWVFGGGWIARMNDSLTALAEPPRLIQPHDSRKGLSPGGQILQVGQGGAFLFKKDGTYHLLAAGIHGRLGVPCYDTWVATAKSLNGPWSRRKLTVPHGGQSTMFAGPDGQWYATFSGVDCRAAVRERAAIVPVDWVESSSGYWTAKGEPWPWKRPQVITEAWGWEHARPISELSFRDPVAVNGGDGYFYATGLHNYRSHARNTCILKGKDLTGATPWDATPVAGFKTVDDVPWFKDPGEPGSFLIPLCKIFPAKNTFWISLAVPGGKRTLRSESGTMNGPWKVAVEPPQPEPPGATYHGSLPFEDYKGNLYGRGPVLWPMTADFSALDKNQKPPADPGYELQFDNRLLGYVMESVDGSALFRGDVPAGHVYKVDGKYLMIGGAGWHGDYRAFGTYDSEVFWANEIGGPWHPNRTVLPHGGNSGIFQDNDNGWWHVSFANDSLLPNQSLLRCLPIEIKWNGHGYDIGPKHKQETPYIHRHVVRAVDAAAVAQAKPAYPVMTLPADIVLQNPSITPVADGGQTVYYLTGTTGAAGDFRNNDGVYLWKSTDLAKWTALGRVASLGRGKDNLGKNTAFGPINYFFSPPDNLEPTYDRGIIAPKLYRIGADWWIVYSLSRQKLGMLKSKTGQPEGPYEMWGPDAGHKTIGFLADTGLDRENNTDAYLFAYDPSLFVEDDAVYALFGPGWIAPLTKDLKAFAERPRLLEIEGRLYAGKGGCQIFKRDGKYHLLAANEWGDVIERTAAALLGPHTNPKLAFAQTERATAFTDAQGVPRAVAGRK